MTAGAPGNQANGASSSKGPRFHGLDALRAFAMLLGIGLHACLSFFPNAFWAAQDIRADIDGFFDEFFVTVHGFRMPAFFLMSGFFTAMLWRRGGLGFLVGHRLRRIAVPLALGVVTIIPATNLAIDWAFEHSAVGKAVREGDLDLRGAASLGSVSAIEELLAGGADIDGTSPEGWTALHVSAVIGDSRTTRFLLSRGAQPNLRNAEDNTPLHLAAANGDPDTVEALLSSGARLDVRNHDQADPLGAAYYFGRAEAADLLVAAGAADPRPPGTAWTDMRGWGAGAGLEEDPAGEVEFASWLQSFHHLWLLWFLLWMMAGFALVVLAAEAWARRRAARTDSGWDRWRLVMWGLIPLTLVPQWLMGEAGKYPTFGPDTSAGLVPLPHVLGYYALFFAFGALLYDRKGAGGGPLAATIGKWWWAVLPAAMLLVLPAGLAWTYLPDVASHPASSVAQVAFTWSMCIGLIGMFQALLKREVRWVRFVSDSAYWLYLAHLPLVIAAQGLVWDWEIPAVLKFLLICWVVTGILLVSYRWLVRYTPVGTMLNGKRVKGGRPGPPERAR